MWLFFLTIFGNTSGPTRNPSTSRSMSRILGVRKLWRLWTFESGKEKLQLVPPPPLHFFSALRIRDVLVLRRTLKCATRWFVLLVFFCLYLISQQREGVFFQDWTQVVFFWKMVLASTSRALPLHPPSSQVTEREFTAEWTWRCKGGFALLRGPVGERRKEVLRRPE